MSNALAVAKNTFIQALGRAVSLGISILIIGTITRHLGAEQFGYFTTITSYLFFFSVFAELGLYILVSRELPFIQDIAGYFSNVFSFKAIVSALWFSIAAVAIWFTPYATAVKIGACLSAAGYWANTFVSICAAYFQFKLNTKSVAIADVLNKATTFGVVWIAIFANQSLNGVIIAFTLGMVFQAWFLVRQLRRDAAFTFTVNINEWKNLLSKSWPFAVSGILILFYFRADTIILSLFQPASEVGIYGASYRLLEVLITFPSLFTGLILPLLARASEPRDSETFGRIWQKAFDALMIAALPIITFTLGAAEDILLYLVGPEYTSGGNALRILVIAAGFIFIGHLTTNGVGALNIQRPMIKFYAIAVALALPIYLALIPTLSYIGAALGTLAIEAFICAASYILVRKHMPFTFSIRNSLVSAANATASLCVLLALNRIPIFISGPIFWVLYTALSYATNTLDRALITKTIDVFKQKIKTSIRA